MIVRKLMLTGLLAVAAMLAFTTDAQAFGKRKKSKGCDSCATAAPVSTGCGGCGVAMAGPGGVGYAMAPEAMPATGTATTGGTVVPVAGATMPQTNYVTPAGYSTVVDPSGTSRTRRGVIRR